MSPAEIAAFQSTMKSGLASTNQNEMSRCPEAIARLALIPTSRSQGQLRVISGAYTSPWFQLANGPSAFVIPFPSPYEAGKGVLIVEGDAAHGLLSLTPGLELNLPLTAPLSVPVVWDVNAHCR